MINSGPENREITGNIRENNREYQGNRKSIPSKLQFSGVG
jgi:hypothetical protein